MIEVILTVLGLIAGSIAGYFFGKARAYQRVDLSQQSHLLTNLNTQITEMKVKFVEIERSREQLDRERERTEEEKERRIRELMDANNKFFKEMSDGSKKSDEEKEKRIKEIIESNKKFFEEQRHSTEEFLKGQGVTREEIEKKRDAEIKDMKTMMDSFMQTVSGTKKRGILGENILEEAMKNSIKVGSVRKSLTTDRGEVEFAWCLGDGKYIPIDSKLPDVFQLAEEFEASDDGDRQRIKREIGDRIKKEIKNIQKYQNLSNTIDSCMLVVPPLVIDLCPELIGLGKAGNVFVCSYQEVFPIAHVLHEQYARLKEEGDVGEYKIIVKSLFQILEKINRKAEAIERAIATIENANDSIKDEVVKGKKQGVNVE